MELIEIVSSLDQQLQEWRDNLPPSLQIKNPRNPPTASGMRNKISLNYIHFAYYGSLMAIHTIFMYPWITAIFGTDPSPAFRRQVSLSMETVADASRSIILTTRYIEIDAASPAW